MSDVMLTNVRLSYPSLFKEAAPHEGKPGKFQATFILDKVEHKNLIAELQKVQSECAESRSAFIDDDRWVIKDGDEVHKKALKRGKEKPEVIGKVTISAKNIIRPEVVDRKCSPVTEADGIIYAGCYVNAIISIYAYTKCTRHVVCANLKKVQFLKDGDAFGGATVESKINFDTYEDEF